jgi:phytoene dehydrogenase-like protein
MDKSITIIGAGVAGLAAGCYARMNGYSTRIFEMDRRPGGLCTAWKRNGYIIDGCIHHLAGASPVSRLYQLWEALGAVQEREMVFHDVLVRIQEKDGSAFEVYTDLDRLEGQMKDLTSSDADKGVIEEFVNAARQFTKLDFFALPVLEKRDLFDLQKFADALAKWGSISMRVYADRFSDPFLRMAFPLMLYDNPNISAVVPLNFLAGCHNRTLGWPKGGSLEFAKGIERRYLDLGGEIEYGSRVEKVLVEKDRAMGVRLSDGREHRSDMVVSAADGHATIFQMLEGRYLSDVIQEYYSTPPECQEMNVHVSFGVKRDLSKEPPAIICLLENPAHLAGQVVDRLSVELFGFDRSIAPEGKGLIKVMLSSCYAYWKNLAGDRRRYVSEKEKLARDTLNQLEAFLPGLKDEVEVMDVATPLTIERYTGNWQGLQAWLPKGSFLDSLLGEGISRTLPGLDNFYMAGQWAGASVGLPGAAASGRKLVQMLCEKDGKPFKTTVP